MVDNFLPADIICIMNHAMRSQDNVAIQSVSSELAAKKLDQAERAAKLNLQQRMPHASYSSSGPQSSEPENRAILWRFPA
jgi:hypothetical protein